jgi:hypothetical protein
MVSGAVLFGLVALACAPHPPPAKSTLTVSLIGATGGSGVVGSVRILKVAPGSGALTEVKVCSAGDTDCRFTAAQGTVVRLEPRATGPTIRFLEWNGACTGGNPDGCSVTMTGSKSVSATWEPDAFPLTVGIDGPEPARSSGAFRVAEDGGSSSVGGGINCTVPSGPGCSDLFLNNLPDQVITLRADVAVPEGYRFKQWSGDCSGTDPVCQVTMSGPRAVTAEFWAPEFGLTIQVNGPGLVRGLLASSGEDAGLLCGNGEGPLSGTLCSVSVPTDAEVQLLAFGSPSVQLSSWSPNCEVRPSFLGCFVRMDDSKTVIATFDPVPVP